MLAIARCEKLVYRLILETPQSCISFMAYLVMVRFSNLSRMFTLDNGWISVKDVGIVYKQAQYEHSKKDV
jgi:hypothetical protein